jgi:hypothetical protein
MLPGDSIDRVHVAGHAVYVDGQNRLRAVGDAALDGRGIHRERGRISIGENGQSFVDQDGVVGGNEGKRRDDHFVAGINVQDVQGNH